MMKKVAVAILSGGAAVAAMTVGLGPASAYPGGCYTDEFGRCAFAPFDPNAVENSPADRAARGNTLDQQFAYFVTHDDDAPNFRIMDFNILKSQALRYCQQVSNGMDKLDALYDLQNLGGYTFDQANSISSAAVVLYCRENLGF